MKILIDLRSVDYGQSGGIENYSYYFIESLKKRDVEIILDVSVTSHRIYKQKFKNDGNIKIISDPLQWIVIYSNSKSKIINSFLHLIGKTFFKWFNLEFSRRREQWANSVKADLVYYPYHLDELQHFKIPVVTTIHAFLPNYSELEFKAIDSHIKKAKSFITSWNYPYQELIKKYPDKRDRWYLIHCILSQNVNVNKQIKVDGIDYTYYLYVSFFIERKNQINLIRAYSIARNKLINLPKLLLVGAGDKSYKQKVVELISELELKESVLVFDYLPEENISYLYHNCKAVIAPTLWEAASGTVLEASYCGKPVLCSNVPPLTDFAEYFNLEMRFFDPQDIEDIAKEILSFENNSEDLINGAKENSKIFQKYDINYFGDKVMEVFNNTIQIS